MNNNHELLHPELKQDFYDNLYKNKDPKIRVYEIDWGYGEIEFALRTCVNVYYYPSRINRYLDMGTLYNFLKLRER